MAPLLKDPDFSCHNGDIVESGSEAVGSDQKTSPLHESSRAATKNATATATVTTATIATIGATTTTVVINNNKHHHRHTNTTTATNNVVSFASMVTVHEVMGLHEYSGDESEASWFGGQEMLAIRDRSGLEAFLLDRGHFYPENHPRESPRGLEGRTATGARKKHLHRREAYAAVLGSPVVGDDDDDDDDDGVRWCKQKQKQKYDHDHDQEQGGLVAVPDGDVGDSDVDVNTDIDDIDIADAYFVISEACAVAARLQGRLDELEAQRIYRNDDDDDNNKNNNNNDHYTDRDQDDLQLSWR